MVNFDVVSTYYYVAINDCHYPIPIIFMVEQYYYKNNYPIVISLNVMNWFTLESLTLFTHWHSLINADNTPIELVN